MSAARKAAPPAATVGDGLGRHRTAAPAIEAARRKLGGRTVIPSERPPGTLVQAVLRDGLIHAGVLLWAAPGACDVWFDDGLARRARAEAVISCGMRTPEALVRVEVEIRMFAALVEGDPVRWERAEGLAEGRIVEKCRYGAIVVTRGGRAMAVGFRKLWPARVHAAA